MTFEQQFIDDLAQNAERRFPNKRVSHQSAAFTWLELVTMNKRFESTFCHRINKPPRTVKFDNLNSQMLPHTKMRPLERNRLAQADLAVNDSHDRFLCWLCPRLGMNTYITHQVETGLGGGIDESFKNDRRHL